MFETIVLKIFIISLLIRNILYVYVYLNHAENNLIDFSLWINNSVTLSKTKSFQLSRCFAWRLADRLPIQHAWGIFSNNNNKRIESKKLNFGSLFSNKKNHLLLRICFNNEMNTSLEKNVLLSKLICKISYKSSNELIISCQWH